MIKAVRSGNKLRNADELVAAILRAIDAAESCRSRQTVDLLKMALLNEGVRLAGGLAREVALRSRRKPLSPRLRLVSARPI